ncbi:MAG TPA: tryptophan-rich sensory protein, partial [Actinomycetes bacterium]|nr:tryptophan-rich sensory protein [Actinomycetes bacterium]
TVAIFLAVLSAIANFAFIPYYPFWSLLIITLDVFVIWAIAAHGGAMRDPR